MASKFSIPEFEATSVEAIPQIAKAPRGTFRTHKTKSLQWRQTQLRKLYWAMEDYKPQLLAALKKDLNKGEFESSFTEIDWVKNDCMFMLDNLEKFAKDEKLPVPLSFSMMKFRVRKEPMGTALIIGPYNFPVQLLLAPFVGAIGAGCTAVLKPSELTPACSMVVKEMIESRLDTSAFAVVNGGVPQVSALLEEKWDIIFFTGSAAVGKIVTKKAAETLTPVVLELGGKNPAFITKNVSDLAQAAKRLLWGKTLNAGQVCMSQNYVLIDKALVPSFIEDLKNASKEMFPNGAKASPDLGRIVNERHFLRLKAMLDNTKGKIVMGGEVDQSELFIEPTAVLVDSVNDSMMAEESFGPIFCIYPVNTLDEAINTANLVHSTPLSLFAFGSKAENQRLLNEMTSGGATMNDSYFHGSVNTVPFGGVGDSGTGAYRGPASFETFTHHRTVSETPGWAEKLIAVRYMPFSMAKLQQLKWLTEKKPNFDRNGNVVKGVGYWASMVLGLGAKSGKGVFFRWVVVAAAYCAHILRVAN